MTPRVLIISNSADLHVDLMMPLLTERGSAPFRLNLDEFPRDYQLTQIGSDAGWHAQLRHLPSDAVLDMDEIGAIWARKPGEFRFPSDELGAQERAYAKLETEQALFSLLLGLDCYWIGHPHATRAAMWKGEQLQRASRMGFKIPRSIVTNSPAAARQFQREAQQDIIFKALSDPDLCSNEVALEERISNGIHTTIVTEDMAEGLDAVGELACHFQDYIAKAYELRVTIVGERLFVAKIHSQDDARTAVDVRDMSAPILYEATELPGAVAQRCLAFARSYGLNFCAIDLIVTPEGEYVFLENNPSGQFLFVEQLVPTLGIMAGLADTLAEEARCRPH
jgi:glutathione synthase/RimK-type ligase-like ATP-grasp enzyme